MSRDIERSLQQEFPQVSDVFHQAVMQASQQILDAKPKKTYRFPKKRMMLLVAAITLLSGMTVLAATGIWKQRMAQMNEQEMKEYFLAITTSNIPSFRYSRPITEDERAQMDTLRIRYEEEGVFPKGLLTMLSEGEQYKGNGIAYEVKSGTFYLPEDAMSEEELLQIVDFYHRLDYSLEVVNFLTGESEMGADNPSVQEGLVSAEDFANLEALKEKEEAPLTFSQEFASINDKVSAFEVPIEGSYGADEKQIISKISASREYLYVGMSFEVQRMPLGTNEVEVYYPLAENEKLFSLAADEEDNLYLSIRKHDVQTDTYQNIIRKLDAQGNAVMEYDTASVKSAEGRGLDSLMAYKLLPTDDGTLYVKTMWAKGVQIFVFNADGSYAGSIEDAGYDVHVAGSICFGEDGYLYVLGYDEIICVDVEQKKVISATYYSTDDMVAAVDLIYPNADGGFCLLSYDGIFMVSAEGETTRILAPQESRIFEEGCKKAALSENKLVTMNYRDYGACVTYLSLE